MGSDLIFPSSFSRYILFQSTLPHGERRLGKQSAGEPPTFQSTLPHGERRKAVCEKRLEMNFNPRSPHGERRPKASPTGCIIHISIHAPRMGSDHADINCIIARYEFQSTLPAWGATYGFHTIGNVTFNFNPRSPHGERRLRFFTFTAPLVFQSTLPAWGATAKT